MGRIWAAGAGARALLVYAILPWPKFRPIDVCEDVLRDVLRNLTNDIYVPLPHLQCNRGFEFRNGTCLTKPASNTTSPCAGNPCGPNGECKVEDDDDEGTFECKVGVAVLRM